MLESNYVTHIFITGRPTRSGYHNRLNYFMKKLYEDTTYILKKDHESDSTKTYTEQDINDRLASNEIRPLLKKLVEVSHATDLYLDIEGKIHKGPSQHPEFQMEFIESM